MKAGKIIMGTLAIAYLLQACDDFIEPDISNKTIILTSPVDSLNSISATQTFQWESSKGISKYTFQIASPSFTNPSKLFVDTTVANNRFTISLIPGYYQWRVRGINGGSQTEFQTRFLSIDTTSSLSGQVLPLISPANNTTSSTVTIDFSWQHLPMATSYIFRILTAPAKDTIVSNTTSIRKTFSATTQIYQWKVIAINSTSLTESATYSFTINTTVLTAPTLTLPIANATLSVPIIFSWQRVSSNVKNDSLYFYNASQILVTGFPISIPNSTYTLESSNNNFLNGTYYWSVKSVDNSGKAGSMSEQRKFTLQ